MKDQLADAAVKRLREFIARNATEWLNLPQPVKDDIQLVCERYEEIIND